MKNLNYKLFIKYNLFQNINKFSYVLKKKEYGFLY